MRPSGGAGPAGSGILALIWQSAVRFNELVRRLEENGFRLAKEKGSIRYYHKPGWDKLIRLDYHGAKEVPTGTCHAILKAAGLKLVLHD